MHVELTSTQRDLLLQLIDGALREIGPEIRHTDNSAFKDDLKQERRDLRDLWELLRGMPPGVPHGLREDLSTPGLVGTP